MPAVINFPSPNTINRDVSEWTPNTSTYRGSSVLPLNTADFNADPTGIAWDILARSGGMTKAHTLDATAGLVKFPATSTKRSPTAYWKESMQLDESDMLILRGYGPNYRTRAARDKVTRLQITLQSRLAVRMEWLIWQALQGTITVDENQVKISLDYEIPAGNKWQVDTSWDDHASATPVDDLMDVDEIYEGTGGITRTYFMNRFTAKHLAQCQQVRDLVKRSASITDAGVGTVGKLLIDLAGVTGQVEVYNKGYFDEAGTFTKFIPNGVIVVIAEGDPGDNMGSLGCFGSTPNLHNGGMDTPTGGPFALIKDKSQDDEPYYKMTVGIYGLPVIFRPYWIQVITVIF